VADRPADEADRFADEADRLADEEALRAPPDAARLRVPPDAARLRVPDEVARLLLPDEDCPDAFEPRGLEPELFFAAERVDPEEDLLRLLPPLVVAISMHLFVCSIGCYPRRYDR
jgi:hypothetical protein